MKSRNINLPALLWITILSAAFISALVIIINSAKEADATISAASGVQVAAPVKPEMEQPAAADAVVDHVETTEPAQTTATAKAPSVRATEHQSSQPVDPAPVDPPRIQFTDKPVEAGNPESYVGTYGQCPFYENAGEKGCVPPPDVTCNADWSHCTMKP